MSVFANPTEILLSVYPFLFLFLFLVFYPSYNKVYTQMRNNNFIVMCYVKLRKKHKNRANTSFHD